MLPEIIPVSATRSSKERSNEMEVSNYVVRLTIDYHVPSCVDEWHAIEEARYLVRTESAHGCYPLKIDGKCIYAGLKYDNSVKGAKRK